MNELRALRLADVIARTGLARSTIYLLISQGRFPTPAKLGARAVGWSSRDIDAWLSVRFEGAQ